MSRSPRGRGARGDDAHKARTNLAAPDPPRRAGEARARSPRPRRRNVTNPIARYRVVRRRKRSPGIHSERASRRMRGPARETQNYRRANHAGPVSEHWPTRLALAPLKLAADPGPDSRFPLRGGTRADREGERHAEPASHDQGSVERKRRRRRRETRKASRASTGRRAEGRRLFRWQSRPLAEGRLTNRKAALYDAVAHCGRAGARRRLSTSGEDSWTRVLAVEPAGASRDVAARNALPLAA